MYNPVFNKKYNIYDIFYCNDTLYVIRPTLNPGINIKTIETHEIFYTLICPENNFHLHYLKTNYTPNIILSINDEIIEFKVNRFPCYFNKMIMSTLVKREDNYLPQWIEYHKQLGVQHFIIYDNVSSNVPHFNELTHDDIRINPSETDLVKTLKSYIEDGTAIVINWPYPYCIKNAGGRAQLLQQNHSLYAFRTSKYIGYFDVDEYINPQGYTSISDALEETIRRQDLSIKEVGSFSLRNRWFYNPLEQDNAGHNFLYIDHCDTITKEGHEKSFVIPENINIFCIHNSILGKKRIWVDPNLMRFNHYCYLNKKERGRTLKGLYDNSITSHLKYLGDISQQPKIIMFLNGGLGNQLFQIASAYCLAKTQNKKMVVRNTLGTYHSPINYFENIFRRIKINNTIEGEWFKEPTNQFAERLHLPYFKEDTLLFGFFQNEKYFYHNRTEILDLLEIEPVREQYLEMKYPESLSKGVFIHYRRGDYLNNPNYNIVTDGYYKRAIEKTLRKHPDSYFYIFSDDLEYCRSLEYLNALDRIVFVEEDDVNSLYLMSKCLYGGIGTNSTFSWWGGWLNKNPNKFVLYPDKWLGDRDDLKIWWKGSLKIRDRPKNFFLTFGGGPMTFLHAVDRIVEQAKSLHIFDHVYGFKEDDLKADPEFWGEHRQFILMNPRGFGYWIWKAYLINKVMKEAQEDDVIMYCDCGNEIDVRKKDEIIKLIDVVKKDGLMATFPGKTDTTHIDEIKWNKRDVLNFFEIDEHNPILTTKQRQANPILVCKTSVTESFVNDWNSIGLNNNHFLNDYPSYAENFPEFVEHRHDQSIFSLLSKKYGIFSDVTTDGVIETTRNKTGISELI